MARSKNVLTLIDGAQACGFLALNLSDIGCDFYSTSTHKWLLGPLENGILYIRKDRISSTWPDRITVFWDSKKSTVDETIFVPSDNAMKTTPPAIIDTIEFHETIGKTNIENRIRKLATYLKTRIRENIPTAQFVTPISEELSGGVVILKLPGKEGRDIFEKLYSD